MEVQKQPRAVFGWRKGSGAPSQRPRQAQESPGFTPGGGTPVPDATKRWGGIIRTFPGTCVLSGLGQPLPFGHAPTAVAGTARELARGHRCALAVDPQAATLCFVVPAPSAGGRTPAGTAAEDTTAEGAPQTAAASTVARVKVVSIVRGSVLFEGPAMSDTNQAAAAAQGAPPLLLAPQPAVPTAFSSPCSSPGACVGDALPSTRWWEARWWAMQPSGGDDSNGDGGQAQQGTFCVRLGLW